MFGFQPLGGRTGDFFGVNLFSTSLRDEAVAPRFFKSGREGTNNLEKKANVSKNVLKT